MNLTANYTIKNLNALIGDESLIKKLIADPNRTGLYFQPTKNSLSAIFRFRKDGKLNQMKIGSYPSMPLQEIYSSWKELRQKIDNGIDPQKEKAELERNLTLKNKYTLNYVFEDFMESRINLPITLILVEL